MLTTILTLNEWAERWLGAMAAILWQSVVLVALAALIAWFLRRSSPVVRYWLWQIVAIKLLLMPFWSLCRAVAVLGNEQAGESASNIAAAGSAR